MRGCLVGSSRGRSKRLALMVQITKQSRRIKIHALMLTVLVHGTAIEKRRIVARNGRKIRGGTHVAPRRAPQPSGRPHIIGPLIWLDLFRRSRGCQPQQFLYSKPGGFLGGQGRPLRAVLGLSGRGSGRSSRSLNQAGPLNSVVIQIRIWRCPIIGTAADHPRRVVSTVNHALVSGFGFFSDVLCALVSLVQLMANLAFFALSRSALLLEPRVVSFLRVGSPKSLIQPILLTVLGQSSDWPSEVDVPHPNLRCCGRLLAVLALSAAFALASVEANDETFPRLHSLFHWPHNGQKSVTTQW